MSIWKQRCWMKNCGMLLSAMACTHVSSHQLDIKISDMVAVAHIINATFVIRQLDKRSFCAFSDIFDERHFITTLQDDVRIVKALPKELVSIPRARKHFTSWSGMGYYEEMA